MSRIAVVCFELLSSPARSPARPAGRARRSAPTTRYERSAVRPSSARTPRGPGRRASPASLVTRKAEPKNPNIILSIPIPLRGYYRGSRDAAPSAPAPPRPAGPASLRRNSSSNKTVSRKNHGGPLTAQICLPRLCTPLVPSDTYSDFPSRLPPPRPNVRPADGC